MAGVASHTGTVTLRPLPDDQFAAFYAQTKAGYADDLERHGGFAHEVAKRKAEDDFDQLFPGARPAAGQHGS